LALDVQLLSGDQEFAEVAARKADTSSDDDDDDLDLDDDDTEVLSADNDEK